MCTRSAVTRILTILLVLRVLASPIALSPESHPAPHGRYIARVCVWPAQRPYRLSPAESILPRFARDGYDALAPWRPACAADSAGPLTRAALSGSVGFVRSPSPSVRLSDCPRC